MTAQKVQYWAYAQPLDGFGRPVFTFSCQAADTLYADPAQNPVATRIYTIDTYTDVPNNIYPSFAAAETAFIADAPSEIISYINGVFGRSDTLGSIVKLNLNTLDALDLKSDVSHAHGISEITGLAATLAAKAASTDILRTSSTLSASLTTGTGATGSQISATKDSTVRATLSTSVTSTIGGPSTSFVIAEICSTNSSTAGNWTEVARLETDNTVTLAIILQNVNVGKGQICFDLPAGWYYKLRNGGTGTHTEAFVSGQKTIYG